MSTNSIPCHNSALSILAQNGNEVKLFLKKFGIFPVNLAVKHHIEGSEDGESGGKESGRWLGRGCRGGFSQTP